MKITVIFLAILFTVSSCAGTEDYTTTGTTKNSETADSANVAYNEEEKESEKTVSADNQIGRDQNIVAIAQFTPELSTFFELIRSAELTVTLESPGNYTVFAPTNAAFNKLPAGALDALKEPGNRDELTRLIRSHLLEDKVLEADLRQSPSFKTMLGKNVNVSVKNGTVVVGEAEVLKSDIDASNGVVHIIDSVLIPPKE